MNFEQQTKTKGELKNEKNEFQMVDLDMHGYGSYKYGYSSDCL